METDILDAARGVDFSLWTLFWQATPTVKAVMVILGIASVWSWAIIIQKLIDLRVARRNLARFDATFWSGRSLAELFEEMVQAPRRGLERIFVAAMAEWKQSNREDGGLVPGAVARIERVMRVAIMREADRLEQGLRVLATVGSTAPFIGLFGTVWGIKTAFEEIAREANTNLAVVAPGIAEALVATALGLFAAIPAVIFYNKLSADTDRLLAEYEAFAEELSTILSRQLGD